MAMCLLTSMCIHMYANRHYYEWTSVWFLSYCVSFFFFLLYYSSSSSFSLTTTSFALTVLLRSSWLSHSHPEIANDSHRMPYKKNEGSESWTGKISYRNNNNVGTSIVRSIVYEWTNEWMINFIEFRTISYFTIWLTGTRW